MNKVQHKIANATRKDITILTETGKRIVYPTLGVSLFVPVQRVKVDQFSTGVAIIEEYVYKEDLNRVLRMFDRLIKSGYDYIITNWHISRLIEDPYYVKKLLVPDTEGAGSSTEITGG